MKSHTCIKAERIGFALISCVLTLFLVGFPLSGLTAANAGKNDDNLKKHQRFETDHLRCFKIQNDYRRTKKPPYVETNTPQFKLESGCTVGKAVKFCAPTAKYQHTKYDDYYNKYNGKKVKKGKKDKGDKGDKDRRKENWDDDRGPELKSDFVCYKLNCPYDDRLNETVLVDDQFGKRRMTIKNKQELICAPAKKVNYNYGDDDDDDDDDGHGHYKK